MKRTMKTLTVLVLLICTPVLFADVTPPEWVAAGSGIYPVNNTMTLLPGTGSPYYSKIDDIVNHDYGGSGSLSVASEIAQTTTSDPKGLFRSILRFDSSTLPAADMETLTLNLYVRNGNQSARGIFNYIGSAGYFTVSLVCDDWIQGWHTPSTSDPTIADTNSPYEYETDPLTHNNLDAMLAEEDVVEVTTLYYDASVSYADGPAWFAFDLTSVLAIPEFAAALASGETFSLLLSPTFIDSNNDGVNDNPVAFNFAARNQFDSEGGNFTRDDSIVLSYTTPEPTCLTLLGVSLVGLLRRKR